MWFSLWISFVNIGIVVFVIYTLLFGDTEFHRHGFVGTFQNSKERSKLWTISLLVWVFRTFFAEFFFDVFQVLPIASYFMIFGTSSGRWRHGEKRNRSDWYVILKPYSILLFRACCMRVFGKRCYANVESCKDYCCNRPNHILQAFYLILVLGGFSVMIWFAFPYIPGPFVPSYHRYVVSGEVLYYFLQRQRQQQKWLIWNIIFQI
jgi:hypothetical protein